MIFIKFRLVNRTLQQRVDRLERAFEIGRHYEQKTPHISVYRRVERMEHIFFLRCKKIGQWEIELYGQRQEGTLQERFLRLERSLD